MRGKHLRYCLYTAFDSGEYAIFDNELTRTLVGKGLIYSYESVNDIREPVGVNFVEFVGEN